MPDFLKLAQEAFESSTTFFEQNHQKDLDYAIRAFRNEHSSGSKYLSADYAHRSRIFRPKTRTIIRKNEAAGAVAFFSNMDVVNVQPQDPNSILSVANADVMKALLEYRLTKTLPWFQLVMGALQDAQVQGAVCSYQYWEYEKRGEKVIKDKPCIDLIPIENVRIDAAASWIDPVNGSPFFAQIIPMYASDVISMTKSEDPKTGKPKWKKVDEKDLELAKPDSMERVRKARNGQGMQDPMTDGASPIRGFETVWVIRWAMRDTGFDNIFYTLGTERLLTDPKPIEEVYFHGKRPWVMGYPIVETHKALKTGVPVLSRPIQQEANEIANQRIDNVKFVLNKRWIVARGRQVDVQSLVRNVPGGVTLVTDPKMDIQESNWPDVTSSSYAEQDRLNVDFDDLVGNFSGSSVMTNRSLNETVGGMKMLNQGASLMTDYLLRTFVETWMEPVLNQLVMLERAYETDETVLAVAGQKAQVFQRFGISRVTDMLLMEGVDVTVNVGMGSTNPDQRLQKFSMATQMAIQMTANAPPTFNVQEAIKEIYSHAGYRDGARFFNGQQDPRLMQAMKMIQQLQMQLHGKQMELQANMQVEQAKIASNERIKGAEIQVNAGRIDGDLRIKAAELEVDKQKLELERLKLAMEAEGATQEQQLKAAELGSKVEEAKVKLEHERLKISGDAAKLQHEMEMDSRETLAKESNEQRIGDVVQQVSSAMQGIGQEIASIRQELTAAKDGISQANMVKEQVGKLGEGLSAMAGMMAQMQTKKRPTGFGVKRGDGKKAVLVTYDDGTTEEMPVTVQ